MSFYTCEVIPRTTNREGGHNKFKLNFTAQFLVYINIKNKTFEIKKNNIIEKWWTTHPLIVYAVFEPIFNL